MPLVARFFFSHKRHKIHKEEIHGGDEEAQRERGTSVSRGHHSLPSRPFSVGLRSSAATATRECGPTKYGGAENATKPRHCSSLVPPSKQNPRLNVATPWSAGACSCHVFGPACWSVPRRGLLVRLWIPHRERPFLRTYATCCREQAPGKARQRQAADSRVSRRSGEAAAPIYKVVHDEQGRRIRKPPNADRASRMGCNAKHYASSRAVPNSVGTSLSPSSTGTPAVRRRSLDWWPWATRTQWTPMASATS